MELPSKLIQWVLIIIVLVIVAAFLVTQLKTGGSGVIGTFFNNTNKTTSIFTPTP